MKKIFKFFSIKHYSLATKVILSFFVFIIIFMLIKSIISIPKIEQKSLNDEMAYITRTLLITTEKLKIVSESIKMQADLEVENYKEKILHTIKSMILLKPNSNLNELSNYLDKSIIPKYCSYEFNHFIPKNKKVLNKWFRVEETNKNSNKYRSRSPFFYNYPIDNNMILSLNCNYRKLNPGHRDFEKRLKKYINTKLLIDSNLKSTKTALFWANLEYIKKDTPLYTTNKEKRKKRYGLGDLSNVENLPTGNLTLKQILEATKKSSIEHEVNGRAVISWFFDLTTYTNNNKYLFLVYNVDKIELQNKNKAIIFFLLPETLIAIVISFLLLALLFKRIIKSIDTLTNTAIQVNQGKKNIRSNVRGEDDIGILGESFDLMLDSFENNIKILDKKVEEKTKELTNSLQEKENLLQEKEILLNEIHHRVKNNLSLTIGLIKLQQLRTKDKQLKTTLGDTQNRIYTMELVHRKLYESDNLDLIDAKDYFISLINEIKNSFGHDKELEVIFNIEKIFFKIEIILPCALILNEIITNFFKYVFDNTKKPKLEVSLKKELNKFILTVKDNGKGLPEDIDIKNSNSLGLKLINSISTLQLKGKCNYKYDKGAIFEIIFP